MNPGTSEERTFPLPVGTVTIGRTRDNEVFCVHKSLSRKHASLECDGSKARLMDLESKNGVFVKGKRVTKYDLSEGDTFRCGEITFLVESGTAKNPKISRATQTLPSPLEQDGSISKRPTRVPTPAILIEDDPRNREKLFALIRATELLIGAMPLDRLLDELLVLCVQVFEVDRIALLTLDEDTLDMKPRMLKTFVSASHAPYSQRVVDWVVNHGTAATFADVSRDRTLKGDLARDASVRGAMCAPVDSGGGMNGILYADNVSTPSCFRTDDLALFRAIANVVSVGIESDALRRISRHTPRG